MMLYLLAYKFKILTGANQMSAATCFKAGNDTNLTFPPTSMMLFLLAYKFKILTGANQM